MPMRGFVNRSGSTAPLRGDAGRLVAARQQIADEVSALRLAQDAPDAERVKFLADLATRLDGLLTWLAGDPGADGELAGLIELVRKLQVCDKPGWPRGADLDALWKEAVRLLTGFTQLSAKDAGTAGRREFWKRQ